MLPIFGVTSENINDLRFKCLSLKVAYTLILQSICIFEFIMFCYHLHISTGYNFGAIGDLFYFLFAVFTTLYLTIFASKWISLMKTWSKIENMFLDSSSLNDSDFKYFKRKIRTFALCFIGFLIGKSQIN